MNKIQFPAAGIPFALKHNRLDFMQESVREQITALASLAGGNCILSGCDITGGNISDGYIIHENEVLPFKGGTLETTYIVREEDGAVPEEKVRYAECSGGPGLPLVSSLVRLNKLKDVTGCIDLQYPNFNEVKKSGTYTIVAAPGATGHPFDGVSDVALSMTVIAKNNTEITQEAIKLSTNEKKRRTFYNDVWSEWVSDAPKGGIILWSGEVANIPKGWALCDGTQGTPDLKDRFVMGYGTENTTIKATGGAKSVTLTAAQSGLRAHGHGATIDESDTHRHLTQKITLSSNGVNPLMVGPKPVSSVTSDWSEYSGAHTHPFTIDEKAAENATEAHENRPPFMVLAYIMKL